MCFALQVIQLAPSPGWNSKLLQQVRPGISNVQTEKYPETVLFCIHIEHLNASFSAHFSHHFPNLCHLLPLASFLLPLSVLFDHRCICMHGPCKNEVVYSKLNTPPTRGRQVSYICTCSNKTIQCHQFSVITQACPYATRVNAGP